MKKVFVLIFATLLTMSIFVGCSNDSADNDVKTESQVITEMPTTEVIETKPEEPEEQVVVLDNESCKITIDGFEYNEIWGYTLNTTVTNKTSDVDMMVSLEYAAVNGVQIDSIYYVDIAPGKVAKEDISYVTSTAEEEIFGQAPCIEMSFIAKNAEDYMADPLGEATIKYYPMGEENVVPYVRENRPDDEVLFDNDDLSIIVTGYDTDGLMGFAVNLYIVNKTDKEIMISTEDVSVNSVMADPLFAKSVVGGKSAFTSMYFGSDLEEAGITDVEEIEMTLRAYDYDDIFAGDIVKERITLTP